MKHSIRHACITAILLCQAAIASASDHSVTIFPAEGNKQCSDYAANNAILQMATTSPQAAGLLIGADSPKDSNTTSESASYAIQGGTTASFSASTTPIDFAILKSSRSISVIIYPSGGVTEDANMTLTVAGQPQTITAMSLCYGLGNSAPPPPPKTTIKSCNVNASLDQTGVTGPANGRALVCNFELDTPFYGLNNGTDTCCVCNTAAELQECDPNVAAGQPGACPLATTKVGTEVTTHIELNNDPYVCTTVAGVRKCYAY